LRHLPFAFTCGVMLTLGMSGPCISQDNGAEQPPARQQLQHIHAPQSIDQELARLTKDLELTPEQQQEVRPLLQDHHDKIQAVLDKNPTASRRDLAPQIHAISDEAHRRFTLCLPITRKNWKRRCRNASMKVQKSGGQFRLRKPAISG